MKENATATIERLNYENVVGSKAGLISLNVLKVLKRLVWRKLLGTVE